jgi:hypothetical protein
MSEERECIPTHYGDKQEKVPAASLIQFIRLENPILPAIATFLFMEDDYLVRLE